VTRLPQLRQLESARQALAKEDLAATRALLEAIIANDAGLTEAQVMLANVLAQQGELERALEVAEAVYAKSRSSTAAVQLGVIHLRRTAADDALAAFEDALEMDPYLSSAWLPYLNLVFMSGDLARFDEESARALGLLPDEPGVLAMAGIAHAFSGDVEGARAYLERSLALDPDVPMSNHGLAVLAKSAGDARAAEEGLLEEVRLHPPAVASRRILVEMYADQERYEEQLAQLAVISANESPSPLTMHSGAQALFNLGRFDEAAPVVRACRAFAPTYPGCALLEANLLKKLGRDEEASDAWARAQELRIREEEARVAARPPP
jgi:tetratricopeptide (TPR) repeat protein